MYTDYDTLKRMLRVAHAPATFSMRRALFTDLLLGLVASVGTVNRLASRLDDARYADYRAQPLGTPLYIVAAPRSGTTFLHRLLSEDDQFTTFKLYQTCFPTITAYRAAERLGQVNGRVGHALQTLRTALDDSSFGGWRGVHDTGFTQDEEDEALWTLALASPALWLALPFPERLVHLRFIDSLPGAKRDRLVAYYRECVQRHLYCHPGRTLLAKNVLLPGRFDIVTRAVPGARFVHVLRHPYEAVGSSLSLFTTPWRWHSPDVPLDGEAVRALADLTIDYYLFLHRETLRSAASSDPRFYALPYLDLIADPERSVRRLYAHFALPLSQTFDRRLSARAEAHRHYQSSHRYTLEQFGLTKEYVRGRMAEVFDHYGFAP